MPERHDSWVEVGEEDTSTGASANSLREAVSKLMIRTAISSHGTANKVRMIITKRITSGT